jgi:hypothetical protein
MTTDEINTLVAALDPILDLLRAADPADKAKVYSGVGLRLTYHPVGRSGRGLRATARGEGMILSIDAQCRLVERQRLQVEAEANGPQRSRGSGSVS